MPVKSLRNKGQDGVGKKAIGKGRDRYGEYKWEDGSREWGVCHIAFQKDEDFRSFLNIGREAPLKLDVPQL